MKTWMKVALITLAVLALIGGVFICSIHSCADFIYQVGSDLK